MRTLDTVEEMIKAVESNLIHTTLNRIYKTAIVEVLLVYRGKLDLMEERGEITNEERKELIERTERIKKDLKGTLKTALTKAKKKTRTNGFYILELQIGLNDNIEALERGLITYSTKLKNELKRLNVLPSKDLIERTINETLND